ncbi:hypothetical protein EfmJHP35_10730 [Enterococcus faecium]|nr:hypothetical protein EfmJHP35_10730 [Enterococcus faecium]
MKKRTDKRFAAAVSRNVLFLGSCYVDVRTWGGPTAILEIVSKGIHKAKGVQEIANYLSIDQKDVIAFGDEHNDLELLDYAGWGVAMANGTDQLKGIANDVTPLKNQEDGLAVYLEKLLNVSQQSLKVKKEVVTIFGSIIYGTDESELILQPHFYFRY